MQPSIKWKTSRNLIHGACDPQYCACFSQPTRWPTYFEYNSGVVDWGVGDKEFFFKWGSCGSILEFWKTTLQDQFNFPLTNIERNPAPSYVFVTYTTSTIQNKLPSVDSTETCSIKVDTSRSRNLKFTPYKLFCWSKVYANNNCNSSIYCSSEAANTGTFYLSTSSFGCSSGSRIDQIGYDVTYPTIKGAVSYPPGTSVYLYQHWGQTDPNLNSYYYDIDMTTVFGFTDTACMKARITSCFLQSKVGSGTTGWVSPTSNFYRFYFDTTNPMTDELIRIQCNSITGEIESHTFKWNVKAFTCSNVFTFTIKDYIFTIDDTNSQTLFTSSSQYVSTSDSAKCPITSLTIMTGTPEAQITSLSPGQLVYNLPSLQGTFTYTIKACDYRQEGCKTSTEYKVTLTCGSPTGLSIPNKLLEIGSTTPEVLATIGTDYFSIKDSTNCLLYFTIYSQEYTTNNVTWNNINNANAVISIESMNTGGRVLFQLPSNTYTYRYMFLAKRQTDSSKWAYTTMQYITMYCGEKSNKLIHQETVFEYELFQNQITKNTLNFNNFQCTTSICCDKPIKYQFNENPWAASSTVSINKLTTPEETASGSNKYKYVVDVWTSKVIEFYIYAYNEYGVKGFSTKIKIKVWGECIKNVVSYNTVQPKTASDHQNYFNFSDSNPNNVPYLWLEYEQANQTNQNKYDISSRFLTSNITVANKGCPLYYSISKILDYSRGNISVSITDYINNIFVDADTGLLTFQYFQRPVNYLIYLKAVDLGNNKSSPITDYHVNLTVYPKGNKIPNYPPKFQYTAPDITKDIGTYDDQGNVIEPGSEKVVVYKLPPIYDRELKPVNLTIGGLAPWMQYYPGNNSIVIDLESADISYVANFKITYKLTDAEGQFTQGSFNINLIPKAIKNSTRDQVAKYSRKNVCSVSPKIYQVTEDGLLIVKFNMTMMTDFDHSLINSKTTKIYILPAMDRDQEEFFDLTLLALNWALLKFEKDTMFIQLYFEKSCEISPLETYDKIAIDFSQVEHLLYSGKEFSGVYDIFKFSGLQRRLQNKELIKKYENGDICPLTVFYTDSILPRQMDQDSRQSADSFSDFFAIVFILCFIIGIIIGMFISDTIWILLSSVRYLQICLHLPMLKAIFPSNVLRFMRKTLPLAHLDIANLIWKNFGQTVLPTENLIFESDQSRYLGYNDFTILNQTLKYVLLLYIIFAILYCLFYCLMKLMFFKNLKVVENYKDNKYILMFSNFFHELMFYKILMFLGLFGFMEYLVQLVYILNPHYTRYYPSGGHRFLAVLGLFLICFVMPIVYLYGYRIHYKIANENKIEQPEIHPINEDAFDEDEFTKKRNQSLAQAPYPNALDLTFNQSSPLQEPAQKPNQESIASPIQKFDFFGLLKKSPRKTPAPTVISETEEAFEGGDLNYYQSLYDRQQKIKQDYLAKFDVAYYQIKDPQLDQFFYPFCIIRRIIYILVVFCAKDRSIQLWWMIALNFVSMCYVGYFRPMKTDLQNKIESYNQFSAALVAAHLLYFAGMGALDCKFMSGFGWSMMVILSFNCIMCLLSTILLVLKLVKLLLTKCQTKNKIKKCQELLEQLRKVEEEKEKKAEEERKNPPPPEKKMETLKSEGYSALYILMQTCNNNKNKKKKLRQLVTVNMDRVKGDNGLQEILEEVDDENDNASFEQAVYQSETNSPKLGLSDDKRILDKNEQSSDEEDPHKNKKDYPSNNENLKEMGKDNTDNNQDNDDDDFDDQGPIYYDFGQQEIPVAKEAPKVKFSPRAPQMLTESSSRNLIQENPSRILIQENSSRLMNLNDSSFSFAEKQQSDLSQSVDSDLFGKVNAPHDGQKIQNPQIQENHSASQLSSYRQENQLESKLSTGRVIDDKDSPVNTFPTNSPRSDSQQIKEQKKQKSEKSASVSSNDEDFGPIYYDFDN